MSLHVEGSVETSVSIPQVGSLLAGSSRVAQRQNDLAIGSDSECKIRAGGSDVCRDRGRFLCVSHAMQRLAEDGAFAGIGAGCSEFCFFRGGCCVFHDFGEHVEGRVEHVVMFVS